MDKQGIVYFITNTVTGRVYVGCTGKGASERKAGHWHALRHDVHHVPDLQADWNKLGEERFTFSVIETCGEENKFEREAVWIDQLGGVGASNLYNTAYGKEWREKLSKSMMGNTSGAGAVFSEERRRKIGDNSRKHMTGRKRPDEVKQKQSESIKAWWAARKGGK